MTIKYFDFVCANGHRFEGSFGSIEEMQSQLASGLVRCPVCDTPEVTKLPSAAHLSSKKGEKAEAARLEVLEQIKERIMTRVREAADKAEDVGDAFARKIDPVEEGAHGHRHAPAPDRMRKDDRVVLVEIGQGGLEGRAGVRFTFLLRALHRGVVRVGIGFDRFETQDVPARNAVHFLGNGLGTPEFCNSFD